jgi:RimJ/RimL family protein N-acetyltransferase
VKQLETERLVLRPFRSTDLPVIHLLIYADPQVALTFSGRGWDIDEMRDKFMQRTQVKEDEFGFLAVERKSDKQVLGLVALQRFWPGQEAWYIVFANEPNTVGQNPDFIEAELTYALGRPFWGQGYALEACRALMKYGVVELGIGRFVNSVMGNNHSSIKLMQRLGFRIEKNLHPQPQGNPNIPGVIGILDCHPPC